MISYSKLPMGRIVDFVLGSTELDIADIEVNLPRNSKLMFGMTDPFFYASHLRLPFLSHKVTNMLAKLTKTFYRQASRDLASKWKWGFPPVGRVLLEGGASKAASNNHDRTPLHYAARGGHETIVHTLIASGADPNTKDIDGWTPLIHAAREGHEVAVHTLVASGADPNLRAMMAGHLHYAAGGGHEAAVRMLIRSGGDPNLKKQR